MKSTILKIIILDKDAHFHETYGHYFETYPEFSLKGVYASVEDALKGFKVIRPDIIISGVVLDGVGGLEGIRLFRRNDRYVKIIMMGREPNFEKVKKAFKQGANGYLSKPLERLRLYNALNSIKHDGAAMSSDIVEKVISNYHQKSYHFFSERENEIIDYLCKGATYKIIAEKLFVTTSTINFHIQNIYLKLNVNSKSEALLKLREL